jgi:hypothetical protein
MNWFGKASERNTTDEVMQEFNALEQPKQDEVALALFLLWESFIARFGGIDGLHTNIEISKEYLLELVESVARMRARGGPNSFYALAPALMAQYVSCFLYPDDPPLQPMESAKVAQMIDRGRQLRARPPQTPLSRLFKPEQPQE